MSSSFYTILVNTGAIAACTEHLYSLSYTFCYTGLNGSSILTLWLVVGLVVLAWLGYWLLARGERSGNLVKTIYFLSLATGVIVTLVAMERALELLARILLGVGATGSDLAQSYDFVTPLIAGLLFLGASILLLRGDRPVAPDRSGTTLLTALALTAALMALPFWVGCVILLDNVVEHFVPQGSGISMTIPLALVFTGVGYIPLELWLRARTKRAGAVPVPQRALGLALLAVGMLGSVVSLIVLLFAILTATLGNPLDQWQMLARVAASGLLVSVAFLLVYGRQVLAERGFWAEQKLPVAEPAATATTIEQVLDELLAGRMTRDQAAEQIRAFGST